MENNRADNNFSKMNVSISPSNPQVMQSGSIKGHDGSAKYKTTITPFGPILPTGFTLPAPDLSTFGERQMSSKIIQPLESLQKIVASCHSGFAHNQAQSTVSSQPQLKASTSEVVRRILANESSSDDDDVKTRKEFKEQATAVPSRVGSPSNPPAPIPKWDAASSRQPLSPPLRPALMRTPRSERNRSKREELEKVQQFLEDSRAAHEKIYSKFDVRRVSTRGARRSLSDDHSGLSEASNVAELRRNIADKYSGAENKHSPLPPMQFKSKQHQLLKSSAASRTVSAEREAESKRTGAVRTPSASSRSPKVASPDRLVSGVFVSYPRKKRSESAPPSDKEQSPVLRNQRKVGGKMTAEEYVELRRNLLSRSEQHAVASNN